MIAINFSRDKFEKSQSLTNFLLYKFEKPIHKTNYHVISLKNIALHKLFNDWCVKFMQSNIQSINITQIYNYKLMIAM